jgi:hypothetical protein
MRRGGSLGAIIGKARALESPTQPALPS